MCLTCEYSQITINKLDKILYNDLKEENLAIFLSETICEAERLKDHIYETLKADIIICDSQPPLGNNYRINPENRCRIDIYKKLCNKTKNVHTIVRELFLYGFNEVSYVF